MAGLDNFFRIFPDQPLILLVRDGRSVVESGMRSFNWDFEQAAHDWADAAQRIKNLSETYNKAEKKCLVVRYEDLFSNPSGELSRVCMQNIE